MLPSAMRTYTHLELIERAPRPKIEVPVQVSSRADFMRNVDTLIASLTETVTSRRDCLHEYVVLGRLYRMRGEPRRALRIHCNVLARPNLDKHTESALHAEIGWDLLEGNLENHAAVHFEKALEIEKHNIPALSGLTRLREQEGKYQDAARLLLRQIKLGGQEQRHLSFVYAAWARELLHQNEVGQARRAVGRAVRADSTCPYPVLILSDVYRKKRRFRDSIDTLHGFVQTWPAQSFLALRRLEEVYYEMQEFPLYEDTLRDLLRRCPENFYVPYALAKHLMKKHRSREASDFLRRALEVCPFYVNAVRDLIDALADGAQAGELRDVAGRFFSVFKDSRRFICPNCRRRYSDTTWHCGQCGTWAVFEIRYELPGP